MQPSLQTDPQAAVPEVAALLVSQAEMADFMRELFPENAVAGAAVTRRLLQVLSQH